jgi:hypothetical protein
MEEWVTGNLESDYAEACKRMSIEDAPILFRIQHPLPPLPIPVSRRGSLPKTSHDNSNSLFKSTVGGLDEKMAGAVKETAGASQSISPAAEVLGVQSTTVIHETSTAAGGLASTKDATQPPEDNYYKPKSRYRFRPTICVETQEVEEEEEIFKVEVRGWKLSLKVMEALSVVLPACTSLSHLW